MKVIRIDKDVWRFLKHNAVPLEDNPNSVLRRLLGIDQKNGTSSSKKKIKRLPRGSGRTDQRAFWTPILTTLVDLNGSANLNEVLKNLQGKMAKELKPIDHELIRSGQVRWKNTAQWAKNQLAAEGLLEKSSPRGVWKISTKGRDFLKKEK